VKSSLYNAALSWPGRADAAPPDGCSFDPDPGDFPGATLIRGDNAMALAELRRRVPGGVSLVYLDPPFLTQRQHSQVVRSRDETGKVRRQSQEAFDDRWDSLGQYLSELRMRLALCRDLLARDGCLVLHVDPKTSHYAKVLLDEVFGADCFASEIVWRYRRWPSKTRNLQRVHDVLLRYVRDASATPKFHQLYELLAASTQATWGKGRQRAVVDDEGRRVRSTATNEESPGVPMGDVWDIGIVAPVSRERTGYPTQKPEALMERLLKAFTDEGDLVVDPYMGSGTMVAACCRIGRRVIGIDVNPEAVQIARGRAERTGPVTTVAIQESSGSGTRPLEARRAH
jgi:DNA modification methylase